MPPEPMTVIKRLSKLRMPGFAETGLITSIKIVNGASPLRRLFPAVKLHLAPLVPKIILVK
jgi:hypothetical protein